MGRMSVQGLSGDVPGVNASATATGGSRPRCVMGNWAVVQQDVRGYGFADGHPFRSEAHGAVGMLMRIRPNAVYVDFRSGVDELHSFVGEPVNSTVHYSGWMSAHAAIIGDAQGRIDLLTHTATGNAEAVKTYVEPPTSFGWNVQQVVRSGGTGGNFQGLVPVKATYRCSQNTLVVVGEGGGTNQDGKGGIWRIRSTVVYRRIR